MDAPFVVSRCSRPLSSATVAAASAFPGVAPRYLWLMRSSSQHSCVEAPSDSDVVVGGRRRPGRSRSRVVPNPTLLLCLFPEAPDSRAYRKALEAVLPRHAVPGHDVDERLAVDELGISALSYALIFNRLSVLKQMLATARPDAAAFRRRDSLGNTLLHYCVFFGSDAAVDAVLGAARASGVGLSTAGSCISRRGDGDAVRSSLRCYSASALGMDVENAAHMTPLHLAAAAGNTRLAHELVRLSLCSPAREDSRLGLRADQWLAMCWPECEQFAWCTFAVGYGLLFVSGADSCPESGRRGADPGTGVGDSGSGRAVVPDSEFGFEGQSVAACTADQIPEPKPASSRSASGSRPLNTAFANTRNAAKWLRQEMEETRRERQLARTRAERVALATLEYYMRRTPAVWEWERSLRGLLMMLTATGSDSGAPLDRVGTPARLLRDLLESVVRPLREPRLQESDSYANLLIDAALASANRVAAEATHSQSGGSSVAAAQKSDAPLDNKSTTLTNASSVSFTSEHQLASGFGAQVGASAVQQPKRTLSPRSTMSAVTRMSLIRYPSSMWSNSSGVQEDLHKSSDRDSKIEGCEKEVSGHVVRFGPATLLGDWEAEHCPSYRPSAHPPPRPLEAAPTESTGRESQQSGSRESQAIRGSGIGDRIDRRERDRRAGGGGGSGSGRGSAGGSDETLSLSASGDSARLARISSRRRPLHSIFEK